MKILETCASMDKFTKRLLIIAGVLSVTASIAFVYFITVDLRKVSVPLFNQYVEIERR